MEPELTDEPVETTGGEVDNLDTEKSVKYVSPNMEFGTLELTEELKKAAFKAVMDRFNGVKSERQKKFEEYDRLETIYNMKNTNDANTLSEVMVTDAFNATEDWVALMEDAKFPTDIPFAVKGKKQQLPPLTTEFIRKVLGANMKDTKYEDESEKVDRQAIKFGTFVSKCTLKICDDTEIRMVSKNKVINVDTENGPMKVPAMDQMGNPIIDNTAERYIEVEDRPSYSYVDLRKLYFRRDKANWMIELLDSNWSEIEHQAKEGIYSNIDLAKKVQYPGCETEDEENPDSRSTDGDVELMEAHHIPVKIKDEKVLCIVVIANRKEVIRVQPTPYTDLPYLLTQFFEAPGVEGRGLLEVIWKPVIEMNTRRTQALDANTQGLYSMKAVNMKYIKKPEQLKIRKDGIIELKETDKPIDQIISFFRPPVDYSQIAVSLVDRVAMDIVRSSRLKGVLAGEKVTPNPTASEWSGMMKEALKSIKLILKRAIRGQMEEWLNRAYIMNCLNRQKTWRIPIEINPNIANQLGMPAEPMQQPVWYDVTPEEIYSNGISIECLGVTYMTDEITARHQALQKMDLMVKYGQLPMVNEQGTAVIPDFYKELKKLLVSFGEEHPESAFRPAPAPMIPPGVPAGKPSVPMPPTNVGQQKAPNPIDIMRQASAQSGVSQ